MDAVAGNADLPKGRNRKTFAVIAFLVGVIVGVMLMLGWRKNKDPQKPPGIILGEPVHVHTISPSKRRPGEQFVVRVELDDDSSASCGQWVDIEYLRGGEKFENRVEEIWVPESRDNWEFQLKVKADASPGAIEISARSAGDPVGDAIPANAEVISP